MTDASLWLQAGHAWWVLHCDPETSGPNALWSTDLGLTRKEINGLLHAVDENEDGEISYEEFAPLAFDLCVQIYARQLAHESLVS